MTSVSILTRFYVRTTQFTKQDAGYTATDYVLSLMLKRRACRWISATNADNVYGSQVVQNVLHAPPDPITRKVADMLLNPIDSRNFMWVGKLPCAVWLCSAPLGGCVGGSVV
jgi:hypothetical protein